MWCIIRCERPTIKGHSSTTARHQAAAAASLHFTQTGFGRQQIPLRCGDVVRPGAAYSSDLDREKLDPPPCLPGCLCKGHLEGRWCYCVRQDSQCGPVPRLSAPHSTSRGTCTLGSTRFHTRTVTNNPLGLKVRWEYGWSSFKLYNRWTHQNINGS